LLVFTYLHGCRHVWRDFVAIYVVLTFFNKIFLIFTWFSLSFERDFGVIYVIIDLFGKILCHLRGSRFVYRDFVVIYVVLACFGKFFIAIYVVLALFGQILWLFTWFSPSLEKIWWYLHGSRGLWRDLVVIYVVLAFFG